MVTDEQVRLMRQKMEEGKTQVVAAATTGMSERTARTWQSGPLPSTTKKARDWRTRPDPLVGVWDSDVVPLLESDEKGELEAVTVLDVLIGRHPEQISACHLRTVQRRMRDWRALHGPRREVFFEQRHEPGREGAFDFTDAAELGVTIAGQAFAHLLFTFVLSFSGWTWVALAFGETFEALAACLQGALWALGGAPAIARSDNLSAATHELQESRGRELTKRYRALLEHYDMKSTRIEPGEAHQNAAEKSNDLVKRALTQALLIRGSRDFADRSAYELFVHEVVDRARNRGIDEALAEERARLKRLPPMAVPSYTVYRPRVRRWSTIVASKRIYSVPSRLIGHEVEVRVHADVVEVLYRGKLVETMPRVRGDKDHHIDYRHVIWSLVRKPGAFARYRFREELFPTLTFRKAYDALCSFGERADVEYVRILHLAASTSEAVVEQALATMLSSATRFDYVAVKAIAKPDRPAVPLVTIGPPDLQQYDRLLLGQGGGR
jgi:hypothetical protein